MVAVVDGAIRQEDSNFDVQLYSSGCAGDPGLHLDEGVRVNSQGLKFGKAVDVDLGPCVWDSFSVDFGVLFSLDERWFIGFWRWRCAYVSSWRQRATENIGEDLEEVSTHAIE